MSNPWDEFESASPAPVQPQAPAAPAQTPASDWDEFEAVSKPAAPVTQPAAQLTQQHGTPTASDAMPGTPVGPSAAPKPTSEQARTNNGVLTGMFKQGASRERMMQYAQQNGMNVNAGDLDAAIAWRSRNKGRTDGFRGFVSDDQIYKAPVENAAPKARPEGVSTLEAGLNGLAMVVPGAERIDAALDATYEWMWEGADIGESYDRNLDYNRRLTDQSWDEHPYAYGTGFVAGVVPSMFIGGGATTAVGAAGRAAGQSALYSVADSREDLSTLEGITEAGIDATKDAALGAVLGGGLHKLANRAGSIAPTGAGQEVVDASTRLSRGDVGRIPVSPGHTGGRVMQMATRFSEDMPFAGVAMRSKHHAIEDRAGQALDRATDELGATVPNRGLVEGAERLQDANVPGSLAAYEGSVAAKFKPNYDRIDTEGGNIVISPRAAVAFLDRKVAEALTSIKGDKTPWLAEAQRLRERISKGEFTLSDYRNFRIELRLSQGNSFGELSPKELASLKGVEEGLRRAITSDIHAGLSMAGKADVSKLLHKTDSGYAAAMEVNNTIRPLLKLSPEKLASRLESMANARTGDAGKLGQLMSALSREERTNVQAMFVQRLGSPNAGSRTGEFSLETFLTRWGGDGVRSGMSQKAKDLLFTGQTRRDLDDLATLARANRRLSGRRSERNAVTGALTLVLSGGTALSASLLAVPGLARTLVALGRGGRAAAPRVARGLDRLAQRHPAQAMEILGLRDLIQGGPRHVGEVSTDTEVFDPSQYEMDAIDADSALVEEAPANDSGLDTDPNMMFYDENGNPIQQ